MIRTTTRSTLAVPTHRALAIRCEKELAELQHDILVLCDAFDHDIYWSRCSTMKSQLVQSWGSQHLPIVNGLVFAFGRFEEHGPLFVLVAPWQIYMRHLFPRYNKSAHWISKEQLCGEHLHDVLRTHGDGEICGAVGH
jgi:hypothetical protein